MPVDELNENMEANEALVEEPKTIGALLLLATKAKDPPKENLVDFEPNIGDLVVCQLELNKLELLVGALKKKMHVVNVEGDITDEDAISSFFNESPTK